MSLCMDGSSHAKCHAALTRFRAPCYTRPATPGPLPGVFLPPNEQWRNLP